MKISKRKLLKITKQEIPMINVGTGESITIKKLAYLIKKLTNFKGKIIFNKKYLDGTMNKNLDSTILKKLGWKSKILLADGLQKIIQVRSKY